MPKLSLNVEELQIDTFDTLSESRPLVGTVHGHVSLMSCSCDFCATLTDCVSADPTGCVEACGKDYPTAGYWQNTCIPTCQGYTCEWDTCNCTNGC